MSSPGPVPPEASCDVLVVGAGPTGLTLAVQLAASGVRCRVVDSAVDRTTQSRALAVQARTLEVLRPLGVTDELVRRGSTAVRLRLQAGRRTVRARLFDIGMADTEHPYLLLLSQASTEQVLLERLTEHGVTVERGVRLDTFSQYGTGVTSHLTTPDGSRETVVSRYVVGCDGAHSTVRKTAAIAFDGSAYPQTFLLADLRVDGLEPGVVNAYLTAAGLLLFFPLQHPAPWRMITVRRASAGSAAGGGEEPTASAPVDVAELQALSDHVTGEPLRLHDPVWATAFSVHSRQAATYRSGWAFLAGDAAHIHSPAGGQGMNTGIQDAVNLGWKLALVLGGRAPDGLLDSYDAERRPVGAFVLRFTDRAFSLVTSARAPARLAREHVLPRVLPLALRVRPGRRAAFRTVSQLGVRYRGSPLVGAGEGGPAVRRGRVGDLLRWRAGPRPGDRLPDVSVMVEELESWLHRSSTATAFHLLLCGPVSAWDEDAVRALLARFGHPLRVVHLDAAAAPGALLDPTGTALRRLGVRGSAHILVRPDGYLSYRADHADLAGVTAHLARLLAAG